MSRKERTIWGLSGVVSPSRSHKGWRLGDVHASPEVAGYNMYEKGLTNGIQEQNVTRLHSGLFCCSVVW